MAFLHSQSCECVKSELDLFALPSTQTSIESGQWVHYKPISSLSDEGPIEFVIPGMGDEYIDLSQTMLHVKAKIENHDSTPITTAVAPINNWIHSLFSQLDIYLNQKLVSPPNNTYAYRAYLETLLNYGPAAKKSHLTCGLWYADTAKCMDAMDTTNDGFHRRSSLASNAKVIEMLGHLHADIFNQEKFLINGVGLGVKLVRAKDSFTIMCGDENLKPKVNITDVTLMVRRARLNPSVLLAHSKVLATSTAKYPITRVEVKVLTIPSGVLGKTIDNIFLGQIPKRCIIGFVDNAAFNGNFKLNPFNFNNYKMNSFSLYIDGQQIPSKPLQPSYSSENTSTLAYHTLFSGTGIHFLNEGNDITREGYADGYCLMAFDLTPDLSANLTSQWNLVKHGSLRMEVCFETALVKTVNCIVFAEFDNVIEVDKNRNVTVDYNS